MQCYMFILFVHTTTHTHSPPLSHTHSAFMGAYAEGADTYTNVSTIPESMTDACVKRLKHRDFCLNGVFINRGVEYLNQRLLAYLGQGEMNVDDANQSHVGVDVGVSVHTHTHTPPKRPFKIMDDYQLLTANDNHCDYTQLKDGRHYHGAKVAVVRNFVNLMIDHFQLRGVWDDGLWGPAEGEAFVTGKHVDATESSSGSVIVPQESTKTSVGNVIGDQSPHHDVLSSVSVDEHEEEEHLPHITGVAESTVPLRGGSSGGSSMPVHGVLSTNALSIGAEESLVREKLEAELLVDEEALDRVDVEIDQIHKDEEAVDTAPPFLGLHQQLRKAQEQSAMLKAKLAALEEQLERTGGEREPSGAWGVN
jgi:hypothetical protein